MITCEEARRYFRYEPKTGLLFWADHWRRLDVIGREAGIVHHGIHKIVHFNHGQYQVHRIIWLMMTGAWPEFEVDHKDRNGLNNKWKNLRPATDSEQRCNANLYKNNKSGYRGVSWSARDEHWRVKVKKDNKYVLRASFADKNEAIAAATKARLAAHGEYYGADQ